MLVPALLVLFSNILSSSAWTHSCECYPVSYVQSYNPNWPIVDKTQDHHPRPILVNSQPVPIYPQPVPVYRRPIAVSPRPTTLPPISPRPSSVDQPRPYYLGHFPSDEPTALSPIHSDARPPYLDNPLPNQPQPKGNPLRSPLEPIDQSQPAPNYRRMGGSALSELLSLPGAVAESFLSGGIKV